MGVDPRSILDGGPLTSELGLLSGLEGVRVVYGDPVVLMRVPNGPWGVYDLVAQPVIIVVVGGGLHFYVDMVKEAPWQVGGDRGEVRRLWSLEDYEVWAEDVFGYDIPELGWPALGGGL